jgi:hypothetical protein
LVMNTNTRQAAKTVFVRFKLYAVPWPLNGKLDIHSIGQDNQRRKFFLIEFEPFAIM